jgi:hypothetical protein
MLFTAGTCGEKSAGRFRGYKHNQQLSHVALRKKQVLDEGCINPKGAATHASLINARLSDMSLYIVEFFIASRVVMRNRN